MPSDGNPDRPDDADPAETDEVRVPDFISFLPDRIWYLTGNGQDMWSRRPYGFFFTSAEAAERFAAECGTALTLSPIGMASKELVSSEGIEAFRRMELTRLFVDPKIDPASGDVFGTILRLAPIH